MNAAPDAKADESNGLQPNFVAYEPYPNMKKRPNSVRVDDLCRRLKKKLGRRWDGEADEGPRKAQRMSLDQCSNSTRWSVNDRIMVFQEAANEFLKNMTVWQLVPQVTTVSVLDSQVGLNQAIALLSSDSSTPCAPVWDSNSQAFKGVLTFECLFDAVIASQDPRQKMLEAKLDTIHLAPMELVALKEPLTKRVQACMGHHSHFCIVGNSNKAADSKAKTATETNILNVCTTQHILGFLFGQLSAYASGGERVANNGFDGGNDEKTGGGQRAPNLFDQILNFTVDQLGIVNKDVVTMQGDHVTLIHILRDMVEHSIPHVVVLDKQGKAIEMYSRSEIRLLSGSVLDLMEAKATEAAARHPRLCTFCTKSDNLRTVMAKMNDHGKVLVCVDSNRRFEGLVSYNSLLSILDNKQPHAGTKSVDEVNIADVVPEAKASELPLPLNDASEAPKASELLLQANDSSESPEASELPSPLNGSPENPILRGDTSPTMILQ